MGIMLFYWLSFCLTMWAWFKAIVHLCQLQFVRGTIWFSIGCGMLFWWFDENVSFDEWWQVSLLLIVLGALGTFVRFYNRHQRAAQAVTPFEPAPFEPAPVTLNINIKFDSDRKSDHRAELAALASALRGAIGTEQGPRRIGPTIIN
jgi:hypothetical protein